MALIERNILIYKLSEIPGFKDEECETMISLRDLRTLIDMIPAVDAAPIAHEKWHYYTNDEGKARWRCTRCGKTIRRGAYEKLYCSRCGSRMEMES